MKKTLAILITTFSLSLGLTPGFIGISGNLVIEAAAHPGRTDANGGHRDNKNKSGLGSYHYHCGGYPAHLHPGGICPYTSTTDGSLELQLTPPEEPSAYVTEQVRRWVLPTVNISGRF